MDIKINTSKCKNLLKDIVFRIAASLAFFLLPVSNLVAQKNEKNAAMVQQYDTTSILSLLEDGSQLIDKRPEEALQNFITAAERSRQLNYAKGLALSNSKMARWYFGNNTDKAIEYARQSLQYFETGALISTEDKAEVHLLLAESFDEQGRQDSSAYYYYLLSSEIELGNISNPQLAVDLYTKLAIFWINLDYGSNENDEYFQTLKRFVNKAKTAAVSIKDSADAVSSVYFLQGAYFHALKRFDSARHYYSVYLAERERLNKLALPRKISTLVNITDTYLQQNKPEDAMQYISKVEELVNAPQKTKYLVFYMLFTNLLKGKALYQQQKYLPAVTLINDALEKLKTTGAHLRNELVDAYKTLADSYEASGDYKNAMIQKNNYISLYDSLMKKDKIDMINRLEIRYRIVEKDKALAVQKLKIAEIENRVSSRNYFIAGISFLAFFTAFGFVLWRRKNIHKQRLQQERIDNLQQKMEIERLNATIDGEEKERTRIARELHDGIGALLTGAKMNFEMVRKHSAYEHNPDFIEGIKLLEETASGLRETAHNIMPEILMQEGLSDAVKSFCERMTGKGGTVISFQTLGIQEKMGAAFNLPVYRIVQELIHNIRKHAKAATALVQMNFHEDGGLDITVEDDGIGITERTIKDTNGMGLNNIQERVRQLGGRIDINSSLGKGTSIYLEFEFLKNNGI
jgi:two-component system, NarL family, sensor kinase